MTTITIHHAKVDKAFDICNISVTTWKATYKSLIDSSFLDNLSVSKTSIKKWTDRIKESKSKREYVFIASISSQTVGFLWGGPSRGKEILNIDSEIYAFYVLPKFQHQGVGKKLFSEFKKTNHTFFLWMLKNNPSEVFYQKQGGQKTDMVKTQIIGDKEYKEIAYIFH